MEATRKGNGNNIDTAATIAPVVDRVAASAHDAVDRAASAATSAAKMLDKKGAEFKNLQSRYLDTCREQVRDNPMAALGIAVAAGFLLSILISRR
jgi:ElaB/YqjD/DUF883 family membrane-anchored ribosome-binding protein